MKNHCSKIAARNWHFFFSQLIPLKALTDRSLKAVLCFFRKLQMLYYYTLFLIAEGIAGHGEVPRRLVCEVFKITSISSMLVFFFCEKRSVFSKSCLCPPCQKFFVENPMLFPKTCAGPPCCFFYKKAPGVSEITSRSYMSVFFAESPIFFQNQVEVHHVSFLAKGPLWFST